MVSLDGKVHDPQRIDYTARYLTEFNRAIGDGVEGAGYFHWSLMGNFEWALSYTWAKKGCQPTVKTSGVRKAFKVWGLVDYFSGQLFWQGQTGRFTAQSYCNFLQSVLDWKGAKTE